MKIEERASKVLEGRGLSPKVYDELWVAIRDEIRAVVKEEGIDKIDAFRAYFAKELAELEDRLAKAEARMDRTP